MRVLGAKMEIPVTTDDLKAPVENILSGFVGAVLGTWFGQG